MENDKIEVIVSAPREIRQKPAALSCSAPRKQAGKGLWPLFFAILCVTLLAEAVLFVDTQLAGINKILKDDFRIILIPGGKIPLDQAKVTEEKIRALSGVADVFFVDSQTRLERLQRWDADIIHSIVLLGKNPIPDSFEIHIEEKALGDAASLAESAREACGAGAEAKYKPVQAYAILQVLFYRRFFAFCLSRVLGFNNHLPKRLSRGHTGAPCMNRAEVILIYLRWMSRRGLKL